MLGNRLNNISADVIFCVWGQYVFELRTKVHAKRIIGYK